MNISKNNLIFTAGEYDDVMFTLSDVLIAYLDLIHKINEEENLRRNHRTYLDVRKKIIKSITENEKMVNAASELVDNHLGFSRLFGTPNIENTDKDKRILNFANDYSKSMDEKRGKPDDFKKNCFIAPVNDIFEIISDAVLDILALINYAAE